MKSIDSKTKWGRVAMIRTIEKERYYFMVSNKGKCVSMMPADVVEAKERRQ